MHAIAGLPVVVPFLAAALLVAVGSFSPRWGRDAIASSVTLAVVVACVVLAHQASAHSYVYWVGGWYERPGGSLGIGLEIDPLSTGVAAFSAVLVLAAFAYSLHYFDAIAGLFHALMLLFLVGLMGFTLTGDLFDLLVFFELMSVVAYALTGYLVEERAPIQGAINFAVTNSVGGYAMFIGVGLLYARTGTLNMTPMGAALDGHRPDALVILAMVLLFLGFFTKAAVVPLHFWLADAQAAAPVPVCVLFTGVMVGLGLFGVAHIYWEIFAGVMGGHVGALRAILVATGVVTAMLGAWLCLLQRHIKRMVAYSTISHVGLALCALGLLSARALAGMVVFLGAHGLVTAALFMLCGTLLHRFRTVDEYDLHGRGRDGGVMKVVGGLFAASGLLLAALPPLAMFNGAAEIERSASTAGYGWLVVVFVVVAGATAGTVLRVAGRVFLGWGPTEGPDPAQARAAEERVDETRDERDHTPPLMYIVPGVLLLLASALSFIPGALAWVAGAATLFTDHHAYTAWATHGARYPLPHAASEQPTLVNVVFGAGGVVLAAGTAVLGLFGRPLRESLPAGLAGGARSVARRVRRLHSGHIGDYIAWWTAGAASFGAVCLLALR